MSSWNRLIVNFWWEYMFWGPQSSKGIFTKCLSVWLYGWMDVWKVVCTLPYIRSMVRIGESWHVGLDVFFVEVFTFKTPIKPTKNSFTKNDTNEFQTNTFNSSWFKRGVQEVLKGGSNETNSAESKRFKLIRHSFFLYYYLCIVGKRYTVSKSLRYNPRRREYDLASIVPKRYDRPRLRPYSKQQYSVSFQKCMAYHIGFRSCKTIICRKSFSQYTVDSILIDAVIYCQFQKLNGKKCVPIYWYYLFTF